MNDGGGQNVTMAARPVSVFVSYAHEDRTRAEQIIAALEGAGCTVWWDALVDGGTSFAKSIEDALEQASAVLVIWSKESVASHWVRDEAERGRDRGRLVPVTFDGSPPPMGFRQVQTVDMARWRGGKTGPLWTELMRAVMLAAGASEVPERVTRAGATGPSRRTLMLGGGAAALAAMGGIGAWQAGVFEPAASDNSIAVIPFKNLSGDPGQDYLAEGISEEIRLELMRNSALRVMASGSVGFALEGNTSVANIAEILKVGMFLNGSVRRSGDRLRVTAELANAVSSQTTWAEKFDRPMAEIFEVQAEIARAVASALSAQLEPNDLAASETWRRQAGGTTKVAAYEAYLRGEAFYRLRSGEGAYRAALAQYDEAVAHDSDYALAHAARARMITVITNNFVGTDFRREFGRALSAARRAAALAPNVATIQATLGHVLVQAKLDLRGARIAYSKAAKLGAGDATVLANYASFAARMGQKEEASTAIGQALALDPLSPSVRNQAAFVSYCARDYQEAISQAQAVLKMNSQFSHSHHYIGSSLVQQHRAKMAISHFEMESVLLYQLTGLAIAMHHAGQRAPAQAAFARLEREFGEGSAYQQAQVLAQWANLAGAMERLQAAFLIGDVGLAFAKTDPMLDGLRKDLAFKRLLNSIGFD